jgi:hypothetical protein
VGLEQGRGRRKEEGRRKEGRKKEGRRKEKGRKEEGRRKKEEGSRKQEAGSRKQEAGSRKQEAGSRKQEAGNRKAGGERKEGGGGTYGDILLLALALHEDVGSHGSGSLDDPLLDGVAHGSGNDVHVVALDEVKVTYYMRTRFLLLSFFLFLFPPLHSSFSFSFSFFLFPPLHSSFSFSFSFFLFLASSFFLLPPRSSNSVPLVCLQRSSRTISGAGKTRHGLVEVAVNIVH